MIVSDAYIYEPVSVFLYNIQVVIWWYFTNIYSDTKVFLLENTVVWHQWITVEHCVSTEIVSVFRHDTYIYDPLSVFLCNIQDVMYWCVTNIQSGTLWQHWKITRQSDIQQKHLN